MPIGPSPETMSDITLYFAPASRAFTPLWLLEELALPYMVETIDLRKGEQKSPDYLQVNPMGKVPALRDGNVTVSESPAICIYLADRYSLGHMAPTLDDPQRGAYLRWMVFSTAVFEPAIYLPESDDPRAASVLGWGERRRVLDVLDAALSEGPWLLGENFSAADVMLGPNFPSRCSTNGSQRRQILSLPIISGLPKDPPISALRPLPGLRGADTVLFLGRRAASVPECGDGFRPADCGPGRSPRHPKRSAQCSDPKERPLHTTKSDVV